MLSFITFLQPKYWFDLDPSPMSGISEKVLFAFFVLLFFSGLFLRTLEKRRQLDRFVARLVRRASYLGMTMGCLGLLFLFFSFEQARLFGARFWFVLLIIVLLVWLGFISYDYFRVAPRERRIEAVRRQREKYLPKKK